MKKPGFLKSKQEKELEARIAVRQGIRDLEKVNKKLEKKYLAMLAKVTPDETEKLQAEARLKSL